MKEIFNNDWQDLLGPEMEKPYYQELRRLLLEEYQNYPIYPAMGDIFNALQTTSYQDVKVVILGQDPYHGKGQAHGMAFSVQKGVPIPPSLQNIYKELESDLGIPMAHTGYLMSWAQQGVLLLNTTLTVRQGSPTSHKDIGWEIFTDAILSLLNKKDQALVYILWGAHARSKKKLLNNPKHLILEAPHPSPLSAYRGFFGSKPFSKSNEFLEANQLSPIDWAIKE
ncbi:uracil-DNA glycosylase [Peptoniphilus sp. oral taxon 375 str. F0436]|nr:uracil-DNA glycosylase [Peptoniphilus sp. oral taxon 375 str. F0436]